MDKLGILAGGGELPGRLIQICRERGRPFHVIAIEGHADPKLSATVSDVASSRRGTKGARVAQRKARRNCHGRSSQTASIVALHPDVLAARVLAKAGASSVMGDDGLLKAIMND